MTTARKPARSRRDVNHGGLPQDDDLSAFAAAVAAADTVPAAAPGRAPLAAVPAIAAEPAADVPPAPDPGEAPAHASATAGPVPPALPDPPAAAPVPVPAAPVPGPAPVAALAAPAGEEPEQDLPGVPVDLLIRQATASVDATVAERFRRYQRREARSGPAPSNAEVVFRALDACAGRYSEIVAARVPRLPEGRRFGAAVPGRRPTSEARLTSQVNFRPTIGELAEIRRLQKQSGAASLSAFVNAVLDEYLPPR